MAAPLTSWERLTAVATLGTGRAPLPAEGLWPDPALEQGDVVPESALLRAAAATYIWNLAGQRAVAQATAVAAADFARGDPATDVSEPAAWRLARMINGDYKDLIPHWFTLATENGRTLPPHWLPVVLEALTPAARNEFAAVLGPAAQWLASRNRKWALRATTQAPSEERWNTGTLEERRAELKAQRAADPALARAWLQSTWTTDPPEAREEFLQTLLIGLSADDETFLEAALDDKRKGVRLAAAECLSRLPQSAHGGRNLARLEPLLVFEDKKGGLFGGLRKRKLEVQLPSAVDKAATRDGIEAKPPAHRKIGERVFWLTQMIAMTPPTHWNTRFGCDAATFIEAALATEYASELLTALSSAVARHPDREWISALSTAWLNSTDDVQTISQSLAALLLVAPDEHRLPLLEAQLRELGSHRFDIVFGVLQMIDLRWSPAATQLALDGLAASVRADRQQWARARNTLDSWARRCDIGVAQRLVPPMLNACGENSSWRNALEQLNDIVEFRVAMNQELRRDG